MKKRMGKAAALLMAVTMACGMLAGCGSNGSEKAPETAKVQTEAGAVESGEAGEGGEDGAAGDGARAGPV